MRCSRRHDDVKTKPRARPRRRSSPPLFFLFLSRFFSSTPGSSFFPSYRPTTVPITAILAWHLVHDGARLVFFNLGERTGSAHATLWSPRCSIAVDVSRTMYFSLFLTYVRSLAHSLERVHDLLRRRHDHSSHPTTSSASHAREFALLSLSPIYVYMYIIAHPRERKRRSYSSVTITCHTHARARTHTTHTGYARVRALSCSRRRTQPPLRERVSPH